jgi:hypothetical protein
MRVYIRHFHSTGKSLIFNFPSPPCLFYFFRCLFFLMNAITSSSKIENDVLISLESRASSTVAAATVAWTTRFPRRANLDWNYQSKHLEADIEQCFALSARRFASWILMAFQFESHFQGLPLVTSKWLICCIISLLCAFVQFSLERSTPLAVFLRNIQHSTQLAN